MACYLKQGGLGFRKKLIQVHQKPSRQLVGHRGPLLVLTTRFESTGWSWVGFFRILPYYIKSISM